MSVLHIVCQNCGAKYKLPESFQGDKAKCKACGAVIDVAAQRTETPTAAAPKPATARPEAAKPARAAEPRRATAKSEESGARSERPARHGATAGRRGARGGGEEGGGAHRRHRRGGEEPETKKGPNFALIGGILVVVAIAVVGGIFLLGGKGKEGDSTGTEQVANAAKNADKPAADAAAKEAAAKAEADKAAAAEAAAKEEAAKEAAAKEAAAKEAAAKDPASDDASVEKPKPAANEITSRDEVFDPKSLPILDYPEGTGADLKEEIEHLCTDILDVGLHAQRGKTRLQEIGYPALYGIVNQLRGINYFDSSESMTGYELNRLIEAMTLGVNAGYKPPQIGEDQPLADVDWNAKIVKQWQKFLTVNYPTAEKFEELKKKRATRHETGGLK